MTISRSQMYRQLYQMGGQGIMQLGNGQEEPIFPRLETLSQNLGQAEQTLGAPSNQFNASSITTAITGRPTMNMGGRMGYQEGDMAMMQPETGGMMQDQMVQQPQMNPSQMDPKQALEIIIQMLIAQGIPPEQAKEIAIQMVQAVAEGGMGEMEDERIEARFGGRISNGREQFGIGSIFKSAGKAISGAVKGVTNAVKSVVKSDLGKAALAAAAIYATGGGSFFGYTPFPGATPGFAASNLPFGETLFGGRDLMDAGLTKGIFGVGGQFAPLSGTLFSGVSKLLPGADTLKTFGLGTLAGKFLGGGMEPRREDYGSDEEFEQAVARYRTQFQTAMNNPNPQFAAGLYPNNPFYPQRQAMAMAANGGRIGYQGGGIGDLISKVTKQEFFGTPMMANGGRMGYAFGAEVPTRQNQAGVQELDYRDTGGFVPPIGIKEKADDIPAMLSNNEFVFTADAVRNAGGGNVNKGAERMYTLMKSLEAGGRV